MLITGASVLLIKVFEVMEIKWEEYLAK